MSQAILTQHVLQLCVREGFALCGVAPLGPSERSAALHAWLASGMHGSMRYMERAVDVRREPSLLMPGARCAVIVADVYAVRGSVDQPLPPGHGRIARYARARDYHRVMKRRLHRICDALRAEHPGSEHRAFVDTAPMPERELAQRAGLGWIGKNTLLINRTAGSWLVLGGFLTTLGLGENDPSLRETDHCGSCTRCIEACPTGAIEPYRVDARRCISYLTIERRLPIEGAPASGESGSRPRERAGSMDRAELERAMGEWIFGCDICQDVCPHNSPFGLGATPTPPHPQLDARGPHALASLDARDVLEWNADDRSAQLAGTALTRATLPMLQRSASIVLRNRRS